MNASDPFAVFDCSLVRRATGRSCCNLPVIGGACGGITLQVQP